MVSDWIPNAMGSGNVRIRISIIPGIVFAVNRNANREPFLHNRSLSHPLTDFAIIGPLKHMASGQSGITLLQFIRSLRAVPAMSLVKMLYYGWPVMLISFTHTR